MDWKCLLTTFGLVFLAEMGDKTQLATMGLAASAEGRRWVVFAAAALALVAASLVAVLAGGAVGRLLPAVWVRRAAGVLFLVLGALYLATAR